MQAEKFSYDNRIVRLFMIASVVFGIVGMLVGLLVAMQLYLPSLNFGIPYTTFGRIRPLHTNAMAISIGHSSSAYSFEVVYPNGRLIAAASIMSCQPQKFILLKRGLNIGVLQSRGKA